MLRLRRVTTILLLCVSGLAFAQSDAEWYLNKPIQDIEFSGLDTIDENELSAIIEPFIGEEFTEQRFLDLQRRLYALDYFEQIIPNAVRADGSEEAVVIRFEVRERPVISEIEFIGNGRLGRNRLLDVTLLKRGDMVTNSKLRIDEEAIRALYLDQGFPDVEVRSEFIQDGEDNIVRFIVQEGNQISIESIVFVGNTFAADTTLRGEMELREQNLFNKGLFNAAKLETDRNRLRRYYYQYGYIDAEVVDVEQTLREDPEKDRSYMTLTIYIEEGEQYTFGGVTFEGNSIFSDEELGDLVRLEAGDLLDLNSFDADYQRVADRYYEDGYIFNQISRQEERDETQRTISYRISIIERNRAHIENIIFRGNEKTRDYVLEREIPLEVGDVFSATKIREGLRNLANLQYFAAITPETPPGSADGLMDLVINLEEASTADITFGVAFGGNQDYPVSAQIQWQDRNFLGRGQTFGIQGIASPINQQISFNFLERWLFGRRWSGGVNLLFERSIISNVPQDAVAPIYADGDEDAVPDPFSADDYVFTDDTSYGGVDYEAGDRFPGVPTSDQISTFGLQTEYEYLGSSTSNIPDENLMSYDSYSIRLSANTGYTFRTPVGRFIPRTSIATSINYITYDDTLYRPRSETTRANLNTWQFKNSWSLGAALDNRDFIYSPSTGYRLDQGFTFVGGLLSGQRHYVRTTSTAEQYFTLWDIPAGDWNFKMVLAMQSELSFILPNFYLSERDSRYFVVDENVDTLRINGFFNARGWPYQSGGSALWNNWIELRMPLAEQVIWWDTFFEAATLRTFDGSAEDWDARERMNDLKLEDWLFTIGTGIRFVIPQFPIRLYLAKRFKYDANGDIEWQTGNLFSGDEEGRGLDLVFSIGAEFF